MADVTQDLPAARPPAPRRSGTGILGLSAFVVAASLALLISWTLARLVENRSAAVVTTRLLAEGFTWAKVQADGLNVALSGTAPTEALRFSAMNLAGTVIDSGRLRDGFEVEPAKVIAAPRFSVEMLRNDADVQLIGLLPEGDGQDRLAAAATALAGDTTPMDMLQTAAYPAPEAWGPALDMGLVALNLLPHSKISVSGVGVIITAIAASDAEKRSFEADIVKATPKGLRVTTTITAPRPVLTPFTLRFVIDDTGARFDACSADSDKARDRILAAARATGLKVAARCVIGLGVPSPSWGEATAAAIVTLGKLGSGTVTFSDADITLLAGNDVTQAGFDREIAQRNDADHPRVAVEDYEPADLLRRHQPSRVLHELVLEAVDDSRRHDVADADVCGGIALGRGPDGDVTVGDHADQPVVVADRQRPNVERLHLRGRLL